MKKINLNQHSESDDDLNRPASKNQHKDVEKIHKIKN